MVIRPEGPVKLKISKVQDRNRLVLGGRRGLVNQGKADRSRTETQ
jgi:hypothetical protein